MSEVEIEKIRQRLKYRTETCEHNLTKWKEFKAENASLKKDNGELEEKFDMLVVEIAKTRQRESSRKETLSEHNSLKASIKSINDIKWKDQREYRLMQTQINS